MKERADVASRNDDDWIDEIFSNMKDTNDDDELKPKQSSDNTDKLSARKLLHSKFLGMDTDNIQREKEPPDKTDKDNVGTRYRLTMKAMRGTRLNRPPKPEEEEEWNFESDDHFSRYWIIFCILCCDN